MKTEDYAILLCIAALLVTVVVIAFAVTVGLFSSQVDNDKLFPIIGQLAQNSISVIGTVLGAWVGYKFGRNVKDAV